MKNNKIKTDCAKCVSPTPSPSFTPTITITPTNSISPTNTVSPTHSLTRTVTPSITNTNTVTPTISPTSTSTPTITISNSISSTPNLTQTNTPTKTQPQPTPTISNNQLVHLFNKASWTSSIPEPYRTYFNQAADRWNTYIKYNPQVRSQIPNLYPGWNGLALRTGGYAELNDSTSNIIASCGPYNFVDLNGGPMPTWMNAVNFSVTINKYWETQFSAADWLNIITHELGHALGIGIFWQKELEPYGAVPPVDSFLDGTVYTGTQTAYNTVSQSTRNKTPLEDSGGAGTISAHWENNFRPSSAAGSNGVSYAGVVDELMVGSIAPGNRRIISALSIQNLLDYGYQEVNPGSSEGLPTLQQSITVQSQGIKLNCCEHHNHLSMEKLGNISLTPAVTETPTVTPTVTPTSTLISNIISNIYEWGYNQNIDGPGIQRDEQNYLLFPTIRQGFRIKFIDIAAGDGFAVGIAEDNSLWIWGSWAFGAKDEDYFYDLPTQIGSAKNWTKLSAGQDWIAASNNLGDVYMWGAYQTSGFLDIPTNIGGGPWLNFSISCDANRTLGAPRHLLAINSQQYLYGLGSNNYGQLGNGYTTNNIETLQRIGTASNWVKVSAGAKHSLALNNQGLLFGWGFTLGLGVGSILTNYLTPTLIDTSNIGSIKYIFAGNDYSFIINSNNELYSCGNNNYGCLGHSPDKDNVYVFTKVDNDTNWLYIDSGMGNAVLGQKLDGSVYGWGSNNSAELGNGQKLNIQFNNRNTIKYRVGSNLLWKKIAIGLSNSIGIIDTNIIELTPTISITPTISNTSKITRTPTHTVNNIDKINTDCE